MILQESEYPSMKFLKIIEKIMWFHIIQAIQGVSKIKDGYNPATWMLEVTATSQEQIVGADFSDIYKKSELYQ